MDASSMGGEHSAGICRLSSRSLQIRVVICRLSRVGQDGDCSVVTACRPGMLLWLRVDTAGATGFQTVAQVVRKSRI
jgi:hypothetical protein